eukprot:3956636-Prymnesium_polylepis.1
MFVLQSDLVSALPLGLDRIVVYNRKQRGIRTNMLHTTPEALSTHACLDKCTGVYIRLRGSL